MIEKLLGKTSQLKPLARKTHQCRPIYMGMLGPRPEDLLYGAKATEMQKKPNILISSKGVLIMSTGEPKGDAVPVIVNHHLKQRMLLVTLLLAAGLLAAQETAPAPKAQQTAPATSGTTVTRE